MAVWQSAMDPNRRAVVLASGGVDSSILLAEVAAQGMEVTPVYVRSGLYWESTELRWLARYIQALGFSSVKPVVELEGAAGVMDQHWSTTGYGVPGAFSDDREVYLPGRNLILFANVTTFAAIRGIPRVYIGTLKGNSFPDATPEFFDAMARTASMALEKNVEILAPYRGLSKTEIVKRFSFLPLELTFSCLRPANDMHCGHCNKCAERSRAFNEAGFVDSTEYILPPYEAEIGPSPGR
ncbi:MAG: 7-cyano-7-deazaguanine synthase [Pseudomonadota bacterium]